jgi:hypothetical protein
MASIALHDQLAGAGAPPLLGILVRLRRDALDHELDLPPARDVTSRAPLRRAQIIAAL